METNPLMSKIKLPGRTFQLPSRGALYKNGELSSEEGEIHVHPLSAIAEISLKNPDLLFNGKAIEAVFAECIPDIKKVTELYGRDIDALMFFLRLVTYGPEFVINVTHSCADAKSHSYSVDLDKMVQEFKFLDPTTADSDYTVNLPNGQVVKIRPIKFDHMIKLFQMNVNKKEFTAEDTKSNMIFNLTNIIESVDGETNKKFIEEWVKALTTPYQNRISKVIEKTNDWGPAKTVTLKCKDCGEDMTVELPIDPTAFFSE